MRPGPPLALALLVLGGCAKHDERELTGWLKVDVVRPATGTSGMIVLGPQQEVFYVKRGSRWNKVGSGHPSRYTILNDANKEIYEPGSQPAVLLDLNDGRGLQILQQKDLTLRPLNDVFVGSRGSLSVTPNASALDFLACQEPATRGECRDVRIDRYHPGGALTQTFNVSLGETHPDCHVVAIRYYDSTQETPILDAQCLPSSEHMCLWLVPRPDGVFVRPVGRDRPPRDCSDPHGLKVSLILPQKFDVLW